MNCNAPAVPNAVGGSVGPETCKAGKVGGGMTAEWWRGCGGGGGYLRKLCGVAAVAVDGGGEVFGSQQQSDVHKEDCWWLDVWRSS